MIIQNNLEVASSDYWRTVTYSEAVIYCFSLNIDGRVGWRLPMTSENILASELMKYNYWCTEHKILSSTIQLTAIPVRDLKDD